MIPLEEILEKVSIEIPEGSYDCLDISGNKLAEIKYKLTAKGVSQITEIVCEPYENKEGIAENMEEEIYIMNTEGNIWKTSRRQEAREKNLQYLVVSCPIFHGPQMLLQKRSSNKNIDPGKLSTSAHGVAKALYYRDENDQLVLIKSRDHAMCINTALEINEELRHKNQPFRIKFWWKNEDDLITHAREEKLNDPNTIWIVPKGLIKDGGYPLGTSENNRARGMFLGFVFSENSPQIHPDPGEVETICWMKPSEFVDDTDNLTEDLQACTDLIVHLNLENDPEGKKERALKERLAAQQLQQALGLKLGKVVSLADHLRRIRKNPQ